MKLACLFLCVSAILLIALINVGAKKSSQEDNEFAEFEDFDDGK